MKEFSLCLKEYKDLLQSRNNLLNLPSRKLQGGCEEELFIVFFIYLIIFGYAGCSFCAQAFSSCGAQACHFSGFSCCRARALGCAGFSSCSVWVQSWALEHKLVVLVHGLSCLRHVGS